MKTTKKIFAAVLAVMMIALMIPFSASAAESYSASSRLQTSTLQQVSTHVLSPTKHLRML